MDGDATGRAETADAGAADAGAVRAYAEHRELLFSLVYNLLGSVADTEDVLQDTWLAWSARTADPAAGEIGHPKAYLVRIAVNRALAQRAAAARRRETYVGPWLPEPLVGPADGAGGTAQDAALAAERAEAVSLALLVVLETLSPLERSAFVLHEVFGYSGAEVAALLGRSPAAVRQLVKRAREHVRDRRPRYEAEPGVRRRVTERFLAAALGGDLAALLELLAPDVTLVGDGGGLAPGGRRPLTGRAQVARLLAALAARTGPGLEHSWRTVNGAPAVAFHAFGRPFAVLVLDLAPEGDLVTGIHAVSNPDKLGTLT
ncbi:RNA polymerase sigma factor SigJ [Kitasatospora sp. NPDC057198]|uniref:RNA polymerase sigma factor SigJ n=1 Tax=Kitasatospora sp. NPDC057198 TaxID=3346046 RepID=UPI003642114E